ncbi:hypothetical protein AVEN_235553-1 [Araneus ventricosus]|uniref:Uncharacterized protein n=1 Tax=Araneus ventricosus TaxID=182803 RepID=A0A4Y2IW36_ARAVE|nr:hypothetical protein AVEN_235553-1 [Araneus ventricosus]
MERRWRGLPCHQNVLPAPPALFLGTHFSTGNFSIENGTTYPYNSCPSSGRFLDPFAHHPISTNNHTTFFGTRSCHSCKSSHVWACFLSILHKYTPVVSSMDL